MSSPPVHLAVLVVASDPAKADLATAMVIRGRATSAGHQILQQHVTKVMEAGIRSQLARWIDDPEIDVILVTGAVERPELAAAIKPLVTQKLEGFTDLFRYLAFQELGAGAMLSNAEAAQCNTTFLFVLPGSVVAVGTAMDKLIIPQLDPTTQPRNLVSEMPGPKKRGDAVPSEVAPEKTRGGSGVAPKVPAGGRAKAATGKYVVRREQDDPPTKQIDVARLERQIALSAERPHDAQTKPNIDLRKMLPRVPPGADETLDTDTDVELLAAPPPEHGLEKRLETSPVVPPPRPAPSSIPSIKGNAFSSKERTEPGAPPPRAGIGAKPLPSLERIEGNAFTEKEGPAPGRSMPLSGPRPRPISVPPTNAFGGKEGTEPGAVSPARMRRPSGAVPAQRTREPSGATRSAAESGRTRAPSSPPPGPPAREPSRPNAAPPAREWSRSYAATPAVPMPVTRLPSPPSRPDPNRPISSAMISPPSSSIFAVAAKEAAGDEARTTRAARSDEAATTPASRDDEAATTRRAAAKAATASPAKTFTPSVEMAPLVDAQDLEEDAEPARTREPTPPPARAATAPPARASTASSGAKAKAASFEDVLSTPTRTSGELPIGTFAYPTQKRRSGRALKILALLLAAGAGFAAVVYLLPRLTKHESASATQTAQNDKPPPVAGKSTAPTSAGVTPAGSDHATDTAPTGSDETAGTSPTNPTTSKPATTSTKPSTATAKPTTGAVTKPDTAATRPGTGPVTKPSTTETKPDTTETRPAETKPAETKPTETKPSGDPACDEVACVIAKYDRPCCARYKPATTDLKPRAGNIPEELDRAAVREGVDKIKPAVVACGEKAGVKGTVKLAVSVAPDGSVKAADVAESPDDALGTCVAGAMRKAQFGKTVNGGSFTYPFVF